MISDREVDISLISSNLDKGKNDNVEELENTARITEHIDKNMSKYTAIKKYPYACFCIMSMVFTLILSSFESQAGGVVISISQFRKDFGELQSDGSYVISAKWQSAFSGVPLAAQIVGQWFGAFLSDRFGKKWVIYCAVMISVAFIGAEFAATHVQVFLAGKTLNGLCLGILQASAVSYVADITPVALKGVSSSICNVSFSIGPLVCFIINYCESSREDAWAYRSIFASQWGFSAVSLILLLFVPESPIYYVNKNNTSGAKKCYMKLMKDREEVEHHLAVAIKIKKESGELCQETTYLDCFKGKNLKRTMVASVPFIFCPFSGVYFTGNYTTYWFELAGLSNKKSFLYTIGAQICSIAGCILNLFVVDKLGRRKNILWGVGSIIVIDFIIGGTGCAVDNPKAVTATIGFMVMFGFWYNLGLGSVCYTIALENPTTALRTKTIGLALSSTNISGMVWSFILPYIFNPNQGNLGAKTMFIFAGFSVIFWVYFFFFVPETAERTCEEIDEMYNSSIPLRYFGEYVSKVAQENEIAYLEDKKQHVHHIEHVDYE